MLMKITNSSYTKFTPDLCDHFRHENMTRSYNKTNGGYIIIISLVQIKIPEEAEGGMQTL